MKGGASDRKYTNIYMFSSRITISMNDKHMEKEIVFF